VVLSRKFTLKSPQIINSDELIEIQFKRVSNLLKKYSKFPDGDLYIFSMLIVQLGKYNLVQQTSKSFSLQKFCTFMSEN
jgi:hypothetical protein